MNDLYQGFTASPIGRQLTKLLGLPQPAKLERYAAGAPLVDGTVAVGHYLSAYSVNALE